jgi:GxxExxY protein
MDENEISRVVVEAAIEVHRELGGPGLLESVYEEALAFELRDRGLDVSRQVSVPLSYKGRELGSDLRLDLLLNGKVVVECKSSSVHNPVYQAQTLTYLRLLGLKLGMVVNFGRPRVIDGIKRVVNGL